MNKDINKWIMSHDGEPHLEEDGSMATETGCFWVADDAFFNSLFGIAKGSTVIIVHNKWIGNYDPKTEAVKILRHGTEPNGGKIAAKIAEKTNRVFSAIADKIDDGQYDCTVYKKTDTWTAYVVRV